MKKVLIIILILFIFIVGCKKTVEPSVDETTNVEEPPEVPDIGNELSQVDTLDEELSLGELENLDLEINEDTFK